MSEKARTLHQRVKSDQHVSRLVVVSIGMKKMPKKTHPSIVKMFTSEEKKNESSFNVTVSRIYPRNCSFLTLEASQ
jgi:hypothetical protein